MTTALASRLLGLLALGLAASLPVAAQAPLFLANENTTVSEISFKFRGDHALEADELKQQTALTEPSFFDKVKRILPLVSAAPHPFDPIVLAKDVVRLRRYYRQNGFLTPNIDYPASQLDTTNNTIRIIFSIEEGPPLIIQDVGFFAPSGGYAVTQFEGPMRERWIRFRDRNTFQTGERFTEAQYLLLQGEIASWLRDQGYAFARVQADSTVIPDLSTIDIRFVVDPGPIGYFSKVIVEGNESVAEDIVLRELPFDLGDRFSQDKLLRGQRELFSLNLFRVALADVPRDSSGEGPPLASLSPSGQRDTLLWQPRDSTVTVRYRVREAQPRYVTAETGYSREEGLLLRGTWTHRNFFGGAREFTASASWQPGFGANPTDGRAVVTRRTASLSLRQPYLFSTKLSGIVAPFYLREDDPNLDNAFQELGNTTTLLYEILPFRTTSLRHIYSRSFPIESRSGGVARDNYSRNVVSLSATFGKTNNYFQPSRGFLIRPFAEAAGGLSSDISYVKGSVEAVGYLPISRRVNLSGRLLVGRLWPYGQSADQDDDQTEYRFDRFRFYAGGPSDVRGWSPGYLGPKFVAVTFDTTTTEQGTTIETRTSFEPVGSLSKIASNVELRLPFPGLGSSWRTAVFLDAAEVPATVRQIVVFPDRPDAFVGTFDDDAFSFDAFRFGTGVGVRYETPVGYLRLDFAYQLNPDRVDLYSPSEIYEWAELGEPLPDLSFLDETWRRLAFHFSIGQAF